VIVVLQNAGREVDVQRQLHLVFGLEFRSDPLIAILFPKVEKTRVPGSIKDTEILGQLIDLGFVE
jgi:hypothetical protein